uniref:trimeric intracellular cation channel family protein n=1 Tax=Dongshaea marina TaxID=2047966 RepID=UPI0038990429
MLHILFLVGLVAEGMTGALAAGRQRMDLFGVAIIACATALGGGTIRDLMLGHYPLLWIEHLSYPLIVVAAAMGAVLFAPLMRYLSRLFLLLDAIGLVVFSIFGAERALAMGHGWMIAAIMAVVTGAFGGVLRDMLCQQVPLIFRKELYASVSFVVALIFIGLLHLGVAESLAAIVTLVVGITMRLMAIYFKWSMPTFHYQHPGH